MSLLSPQLEAFMAVQRHGTVHAAAAELGLTQTGVTQRIRALEAMLSTTLFLRSRRGMQPTPEAQALLRYCRAALELEGEAVAMIQKAAVVGTISICITGPSSLMRLRVIPRYKTVLQKFPELLLRFHIIDLENRAEELKSGRAQLAILEREAVAPEMDSKLLKPEQYLLLGAKKWKGRALKDIVREERLVDFDPSDQMSFVYLKKFGLFDLARMDRHFANNTEALAELLIEGLGYGVLTKEFAKPYLERGELIVLNGGQAYDYSTALAWYPRRQMPAYFTALMKAIY